MKKILQIERKQECWSFVPGVAYTRVPSWYDSSVKNLRMSILMPKHREDRKNLPVLVWLCGVDSSVDRVCPQGLYRSRGGVPYRQ